MSLPQVVVTDQKIFPEVVSGGSGGAGSRNQVFGGDGELNLFIRYGR